MALVIANRVQETTTTTGTGTITLAGAASGFQSFAAIGNANTTYYTITSGTAWEVGIGTYTSSGTTLARTTILSSSNGGAAITLAGTSTVFVTYPAEKSVNLDASGNATALGTPASGTVTNLTGTASININGTVGATTANTGAFTTATASTSVTSPLAIGGTAVSSTLTVQSTSGAGTSDAIIFKTGSQVEQFRILTGGGITSAALVDAVGYKGLPQNSQTASYTLALSDMGKMVNTTTGGVVIPANSSVAFPIGSTVIIYNNSASSQTISITTDTIYLVGTATTGSRTLAQRGLATCVKVASTTWVVSGGGVT